MKPPLGVACGRGGGVPAGNASSPNQTKAPSASIAASLNTDSKAIASTRPRLCSAALARRVPNSIANSAMARATYSAPSRHTGPASVLLPVRAAKLIVTAFNCRAM